MPRQGRFAEIYSNGSPFPFCEAAASSFNSRFDGKLLLFILQLASKLFPNAVHQSFSTSSASDPRRSPVSPFQPTSNGTGPPTIHHSPPTTFPWQYKTFISFHLPGEQRELKTLGCNTDSSWLSWRLDVHFICSNCAIIYVARLRHIYGLCREWAYSACHIPFLMQRRRHFKVAISVCNALVTFIIEWLCRLADTRRTMHPTARIRFRHGSPSRPAPPRSASDPPQFHLNAERACCFRAFLAQFPITWPVAYLSGHRQEQP